MKRYINTAIAFFWAMGLLLTGLAADKPLLLKNGNIITGKSVV